MSPLAGGGERCAVFRCFGGSCGIWITPTADTDALEEALTRAKRLMQALHHRFTRFDSRSELALLNDDPRPRVPISPMMARLVRAVVQAARMTDGLVDSTLLDQIEQAGYRRHHESSMPLELSLSLAPERKPAFPNPIAHWKEIRLREDDRLIERPFGLKLDSGGIAKGLFADILGQSFRSSTRAYGVDLGGDLLIGASDGTPRLVRVQSPFDGGVLQEYEIRDAGVATSGIGRRSWLSADGRPAHHLLDPSTGRPAFTGIVQATALAPSALEAEIRAKAAILSGPERASGWLAHGGVLVYDDGSFTTV